MNESESNSPILEPIESEESINPVEPTQQPEPEEPKPTPAPSVIAEEPAVAPVFASGTSLSKPLDTDTKVFAAISYLSILFIIPWVVKKEHPFVAFHIKQGMALFFAEVVVWFILWLIESFLTTVFSYHAAGLVVWLNKLIWIVFVAVSLIGIYYATTGKEKPLPYLDVVTKNIKI